MGRGAAGQRGDCRTLTSFSCSTSLAMLNLFVVMVQGGATNKRNNTVNSERKFELDSFLPSRLSVVFFFPMILVASPINQAALGHLPKVCQKRKRAVPEG